MGAFFTEIKRYYILLLAVFLFFASIVLLASITTSSASAVGSTPKQAISGDNIFYAYIKAGEIMSASFSKTDRTEPVGFPKQIVTVALDGPGLTQQKCEIAKEVAVGQGCAFTNVTAPQTGVYRISFTLPSDAPIYKEVSPTVRWGGNLFNWDISIRDGTSEKTGRLWSELYAVRQQNNAADAEDLTYYYMSEAGYLYKAVYKGFNGQIATLSADAFGNRKNNECVSIYRSIEVTDTKNSPAFGTCQGSYKLFFDQPSGELPTTAKTWDDSTEWISPKISRPVVKDLMFTSDDNGDTQSGDIEFVLDNFVGQYQIKIDTNGDDNFNAKEDITIQKTIKELKSGIKQKVTFNGIDGDGRTIPASRKIGIKIEIEKIAEIHLVNADVEGRTGGIELTRLSGDNAPTTRMCWNDTELTKADDQTLMTSKVDGRNCPDSSGGVHGWSFTVGSWGDQRFIDDWAYASARIDGTNQIVYPQDIVMATLNGGSNGAVIVAVLLGIVIIAVVAIITLLLVRRHRRIILLREAERHQQTTTYPGPGDPQPPIQ
ncbi:hypothetical protein A2707_05790 [Candidatus Saccharibacteria bacterium RIFCSPHIGHO2_01_FULL_45_15]|nr:MAG: hypothetical protein A2707_05790 [Candidatus Saccharibacteria bacterium RIFCSPHIGHO2_01_FULL_45_15]OGL28958.1 MAG: hypothetical protein A3C39_06010 [Candidatus Saccharibacteria bacterium RIFCSPHIGHO2_02_FULL_46_12]OGL31972.1 MAG: hypothetical protein A3E76_01735 [Candidatus Saccharibacteria bacterium RIFCSPHIGHO2_12_FULL_44_22]